MLLILAALAAASANAGDPSAPAAAPDVIPSFPQMVPGVAAAGPVDRFRVPPPFLDPGYLNSFHGSAPKNYGLALGEVVFIDAAIWTYDYLAGAPYAKISAETIKQNFNKGWIIDTDD